MEKENSLLAGRRRKKKKRGFDL
jgi:hypothetical protein